MSQQSHVSASSPVHLPRRRPHPMWPLAAVAAALAIIVALAPPAGAAFWPGAGGTTMASLEPRLESAFLQFWESGSAAHGESLAQVVSFWRGFHVIKAVTAAALLGVLIALGIGIWRTYAREDRRVRRSALLWAGLVGSPVPVVVLLVIIANVQGAVAPLSSVVSLLPIADSTSPVESAVAHITEQLQTGVSSPPLDLLVEDFAQYHSAVAVALTGASLALTAASVLLWLRRTRLARTEVRARRVLVALPIAMVTLAACFAVLAFVNLETAAEPRNALLGFFAGGL